MVCELAQTSHTASRSAPVLLFLVQILRGFGGGTPNRQTSTPQAHT